MRKYVLIILCFILMVSISEAGWDRIPLDISANLRGISITGHNDIWVAGTGGYIAHYDGTSLTEMETPVESTLNAIAMFDDESGWAVGEEGTVLHYRNEAWNAMGSFDSTMSFKAIRLFTSSNLFIIGYSFFEGGSVIHWDGSDFTTVYSTDTNLQDIAANGPADIWVIGGDNFRAHYDGSTWEQDTTQLPVSSKLSAIAMDRDHRPVICGGRLPEWDKQEIFGYTGSSWTSLYENWGKLLLTMDIHQSVGFAGGRDGAFLEQTLFGWMPVTSPTTHQIDDIALLNMSEGWFVGSGGTIFKFTRPGIDLILDPSFVKSGHPFAASMRLINPWESPESVSVFVILDVYGTFYFWPSFSEDVDYENRTLPAVSDTEEILFDFTWPDNCGSGSVTFWGALLDGNELVAYDREELSWSE